MEKRVEDSRAAFQTSFISSRTGSEVGGGYLGINPHHGKRRRHEASGLRYGKNLGHFRVSQTFSASSRKAPHLVTDSILVAGSAGPLGVFAGCWIAVGEDAHKPWADAAELFLDVVPHLPRELKKKTRRVGFRSRGVIELLLCL